VTNLVSVQELVTLALERESEPASDRNIERWKRRVRYFEQVGVLQPARTESNWRLFDAADVALLQIVMRLHRAGVQMWRIKALLAFRGDELRQALAAESKRVLVIHGVRADIVTRREADARAIDQRDRVSLSEVAHASSSSVYQVRQERPAGWTVPVGA
jgi:DNA-binding transcriptional MerR regulator